MNSEESNKLSSEKNFCEECESTVYQYASVSLPIQLKPDVTIGDITVECCDEPEILRCENRCQKGCTVTVTQNVYLKIPISYRIDACEGESLINCRTPICNSTQYYKTDK